MKLGRTIIKKTPLALFAKKSGLSYKEIAEDAGVNFCHHHLLLIKAIHHSVLLFYLSYLY